MCLYELKPLSSGDAPDLSSAIQSGAHMKEFFACSKCSSSK